MCADAAAPRRKENDSFMTEAQGIDALIDPVCGRAVNLDSPYRTIRAGALFCFCSRPCCDRFQAEPSRYLIAVTAKVLQGDANPAAGPPPALPLADPPRVPVEEEVPLLPSTSQTLATLDPWTVPIDWLPTVRAQFIAGPATLRQGEGHVARRGLMRFFIPFRQRRFARRIARDMLELYGEEQPSATPSARRDRYREIVCNRLRIDVVKAESLLDQAEESFAQWPTARDITFRDVVHMVVIVEFRALYGERPWIRGNLSQEIAALVPREF